MGIAASKSARLEKALVKAGDAEELAEEHFFGLENFGNTCYCNSVLQSLYFCEPMREHCLAHCAAREAEGERADDDLLGALADLFHDVSHKKKVLSKLYPKAAKTQRPSARVMYDWGYTDPVFYNGKWHEMAFRTNGSPYWKPIK